MAGSGASAWAVILSVNAPPILSIEDDTGPFTLTFTSFLKGSQSDTRVVNYRVRANNMTSGTFPGAVSARLSEPFDNADLEASPESYQNLGSPNFATLSRSQSGFQTISTTGTPLADKQPGQGTEDMCLDGQLTVAWRSTLTQDAPAGSQNRSLIVTLRDGN